MSPLPGARRARAALAAALLAALAVLFATPPAARASERRVEVYRPASRVAAELLPIAEAALAGEGSVALDLGTNSLVLMGPAAAVEEALAALRALDRARPTVVLRYQSRRLEDLERSGVRVVWSVEAGDLRIGNAIFPKGQSGIAIDASVQRREGEGGMAGLVRVLDGESARIGAGASVPIRTRSRWGSGVEFVTAESGFDAQPRVLPDGRVRVAIQPVEASVDRRGNVEFTGAATTVTLTPGETTVIGGLSQATDVQTRGVPVVVGDERSRTEQVLLLSADVETPSR